MYREPTAALTGDPGRADQVRLRAFVPTPTWGPGRMR
jgi:hypothetical protein